MTDDSVYSEAGDYLGEMAVAQDGARVLIADTGEIIAAVDEQGEPLDPAAYVVRDFDDEGEQYEDDPADELRAEIDELREWREDFNPNWRQDAREQGRQLSQENDQQAFAAWLIREHENFASAAGRDMTGREFDAVMRDAWSDWESGVEPDFGKSVEAAGMTQFAPGQFGDDHGNNRRAYMHELLADGESAARGQVYGEQPERQREEYDLNPASADRGHAARTALMADHLAGHDVADRTYDSSTIEEGNE